MSYAQAMEGLYALGHELAHGSPVQTDSSIADTTRRKFNLDEMRVLAAALGHPELQFRSVLIAGTNGKGSTAAMLANIARTASYRVGLYTSPHLSRVNERIQIDGVPIFDDDFARLYFRVDETAARLIAEGKLPQHPSFFETITAVAFLYFAEQALDLAVLEVGIGGRLDATNIVEPLLSIITDISLDHTEWLGSTIDVIAREKAGILRRNGTLVTLPQHPEANQALGEVAVELGVRGVNAAQYMPACHPSTDTNVWNALYPVIIQEKTLELAPPLAGSHQHRNAALAIAAACELCNNHSYNITPENISEGIRTTRWPGRLELFPRTESRCAVLLDVAHNPAGAWTLRSTLNMRVPQVRGANLGLTNQGSKTLLFGCLRDKAFEEMAQILFPIFDRVVLTPVDSPRSATVEDLLAVAKTLGVAAYPASSPPAGFDEAIRQTPNDGLLVCAGSVYLIGALRDNLAPQQDQG
jgi:dihydrofolate synthase/folylpolyglutamate synthase